MKESLEEEEEEKEEEEPKKIFRVVFTHHNDIFSKNGRRDNSYGKTLSKIQKK